MARVLPLAPTAVPTVDEVATALPLRGAGRIFKRRDVWWIGYSHRGHEYRESAHATGAEGKRVAATLLKQRIEAIRAGSGPVRREGVVCLYVIQQGEDGPIKIGISRNPRERLRQLQTAHAGRLELRRVFRMRDVERALHRMLGQAGQFNGEWFPPAAKTQVDSVFDRWGTV
jgi:hypothetical protein